MGGGDETMTGKDISQDLGLRIAQAERRFLADGLHRAVITTPGCYMVTLIEKAEKSILYRTDQRPAKPPTMQCFAVYGGMGHAL